MIDYDGGMSEGEYLSNMLDDGDYETAEEKAERRDRELDELKESYTDLYAKNKSAKVGAKCVCPVCRRSFVKRSYQQAFNSTKCKDQYWNTVNDDRRFRARIMTGSIRHM